ncbi:hypothetical protein SASPL_109116 [Salvia splendens]|uniref:Uncharacterized protein n=1 Tax=Salvia splendens TaxID=180675 RepID=A0A8X8YJG7_SALSN|nr:hypothetical protein SASPL_109116 [Salvia splendens]
MKRLAEGEISATCQTIQSPNQGENFRGQRRRGREIASPHNRYEELVGMGCRWEDVENLLPKEDVMVCSLQGYKGHRESRREEATEKEDMMRYL